MRISLVVQRTSHTPITWLRYQGEAEARILALAAKGHTWRVDVTTWAGQRLAGRLVEMGESVETWKVPGERGRGFKDFEAWAAEIKDAEAIVLLLFDPPENHWRALYKLAARFMGWGRPRVVLRTWRVDPVERAESILLGTIG